MKSNTSCFRTITPRFDSSCYSILYCRNKAVQAKFIIRFFFRSGRRSRSRHRRSSYDDRRYTFSRRDEPEPSRCLGVFGLSLYTTERDLKVSTFEEIKGFYDFTSFAFHIILISDSVLFALRSVSDLKPFHFGILKALVTLAEFS